MRRVPFIVLALIASAACADERVLTAPAVPTHPSASVLDGGNGAGGNRDFFFLPPLVKSPAGAIGYKDDPFAPTYAPVVEICALKADAITNVPRITDADLDGHCDVSADPTLTRVAYFSGSQIAVSTTDETYQVNWNTGLSNLQLSLNYRIRVLVGTVELGYADVDPVSRSSIKDAVTGDAIPLVDGRTLPIKFRIEKGALTQSDDQAGGGQFVEQVVPNIGTAVRNGTTGTIVLTAPTTAVAGAFFPSGWLDGQTLNGQPLTQVTVVIEERPVATPADCHPLPPGSAATQVLYYGKCIRYSTVPALAPLVAGSPAQFAKPVVVGFCQELAVTAPQYDALRVYKSQSNVADVAAPIPPTIYSLYFQLGGCLAPQGPPSPQIGYRLIDRVEHGLRAVASRLGALLTPNSAYAVDLGVGGETFSFSDFNFGMVPSVAALSINPTVGVAGLPITGVRFKVTAPHTSQTPPAAAAGVVVALSLAAGTSGSLPSTTVLATTDALGEVAVPLTLGAAGSTSIVEAKILSGTGTQFASDTIAASAPLAFPAVNTVGSASRGTAGVLLTTTAGGAPGAAWHTSALPLGTGFSTTFTFKIDGPGAYTDGLNPSGGADGFAFVIQSSPAATSAIGNGGTDIGYGGITNSLAIEFDSWDSDAPNATNGSEFDPNSNHIALQTLGASANSPGNAARVGPVRAPGVDMSNGGEHTVTISYTPPPVSTTSALPGTIRVLVNGVEVLSEPVTLSAGAVLNADGFAYLGFTAATGLGTENHRILSWTLP